MIKIASNESSILSPCSANLLSINVVFSFVLVVQNYAFAIRLGEVMDDESFTRRSDNDRTTKELTSGESIALSRIEWEKPGEAKSHPIVAMNTIEKAYNLGTLD